MSPRTVGALVAGALVLALLTAISGSAEAAPSGPPVNSSLPGVSGTASEGQTLKTSKGTWTGLAKITYAYQWRRCDGSGASCVSVGPATKTSYKLTSEDVEHTLRMVVTATNSAGSVSATSNQTATVTALSPAAKAIPKISGTAKAGEAMTTTNGTWTGAAPLSFAYQWQACNSAGASCTNIPGATTSTYVLAKEQAGGTVRATVTARNATGSSSSPSKVSKKIAAATGVPRINLCGTIKHSETISPEAAVDYVMTCRVIVAKDVTLSVAPGAIVKAENSAVSLTVEGSLVGQGTAAAPITLTSVEDDSVGGDTNSDGSATSPAPGDWGGIAAEDGGSIDLAHTVVDYAYRGVDAAGANSVTVADSTIDFSSRAGIESSGANSVSVTNSTIDTTREVGIELKANAVDVTGNTLSSDGNGIQVISNTPTVSNNTVSGTTSGDAVYVDAAAMDAAKLTGNTGTNNHNGVIALMGTVTTDLHLPLGGLPLAIAYRDESDVPFPGCTGLTIASGATMTVPAGSVIKSDLNNCDEPYPGITVDGALVANGTSTEPVTFTSLADNSVGENTTYFTGKPSPAPGDWGGIEVQHGGSAELTGTNIDWAATGFKFSGTDGNLSGVTIANSPLGLSVPEGFVSFRGALVSDSYGIQACDWGFPSPCLVDASYSYWGTASGPSEANVCGAVMISPYYESRPRTGETHQSATESTINCDRSQTPWGEYSAASGSAGGAYASQQGACTLGDSGACDTVKQYLQCFNAAVNLAAEQSPFPITVSGVTTNVVSGASSFAETSESPVVSSLGQVGDFGVGMLGAVNTIGQIRGAYHTCFS